MNWLLVNKNLPNTHLILPKQNIWDQLWHVQFVQVDFYFPLTWLEWKGCSLLKLKTWNPGFHSWQQGTCKGVLGALLRSQFFIDFSECTWEWKTVSFQKLVLKNAVPFADSISAIKLLTDMRTSDSLKNWGIPDCKVASNTVTHRIHTHEKSGNWKSCVDVPYAKY